MHRNSIKQWDHWQDIKHKIDLNESKVKRHKVITIINKQQKDLWNIDNYVQPAS